LIHSKDGFVGHGRGVVRPVSLVGSLGRLVAHKTIRQHTTMSAIISEKGAAGPAEETVSDGSEDVTKAANGNVMDGGLQRGLKNRHLVGADSNESS
jgi:hypothetical protein